MRDIPTDSFALQGRVMSAMCDDLFDMGAGKSRGFDRLNALRSAMNASRKVPLSQGEKRDDRRNA